MRRRQTAGTFGKPFCGPIAVNEQLEERTLLSIDGLGIAGDSLSDEYLHETYDYALNWVELVEQHRGINVGAQNNMVIGDGDDRGEPRREGGYEYNWARSGATSFTLLSEGQHTGLAAHINANDVSHAVLAIGQNDFFPTTPAYQNIYAGTWTLTEITNYVTAVVGNIETALTTIDTNNVNLVMSNVIDYGVAPLTKALFPNAAQRQQVTDVISALNTELQNVAAQHDVPLVDMFSFAEDLLGVPSITVGGVVFNNTAGPGVQNIFVDDGIHPHTGASGIIANNYLNAFNMAYGESEALFTDEDLLTILGLTYVAETTTFDYPSYLIFSRDYADAPDTGAGTGSGNYETLAANGGPSHAVVAELHLGASVDADSGLLQNAAANADDVDGALPIDEDGVLSPLTDLRGTIGAAPAVTLLATNTTGSAGTLSGWIDYNNDGMFDNATERTQIAVPDGTTNGRFTLTFPTVPAGFTGTTYARFRLSTDAAGASATGPASDGEVEDYVFTITAPSDGGVLQTVEINDTTAGGPMPGNGDFFGQSVTAIGDLNGDGITDLAVGAPEDGRGVVHLLLMNSDGSVASTTTIDHNTPNGPTLSNFDKFGTSVAAIGDLDGDGVTELAVGALGDDAEGPSRGAVHVLFLNGDGTVKLTSEINSSTAGISLEDVSLFGSSVAALADLDGDGVVDLAVGAEIGRTGGSQVGEVHVLFLNPDGSVKSTHEIDGNTSRLTLDNQGRFGSSVAAMGDLNGDGVTDLAVGHRFEDTGGMNRGAVHLLFLNANGTVQSTSTIDGSTPNGPVLSNDDEFGRSVAAIGDLDGNGITDLAVGAIGDDAGGIARGTLHVLLLDSGGSVLSTLEINSLTPNGPSLNDGDVFGSSVTSLGDQNGDGLIELAVGAIGDAGSSSTNALRGAVHLISLAGLSTHVINTNDAGAGSLRQAVLNANLNPGPDTITFDNGTVGTNFTDAPADTITLTTGQLTISSDITISGPGADLLTVSGNNASRVFDIAGGDQDVTFDSLTIADGSVSGVPGGGIRNASTATVTITSVEVTDNEVTFNIGGGISHANGTLNIERSVIARNRAGLEGGGVIIIGGGSVFINESQIADNVADHPFGGGTGGGISLLNGSLTVTSSTISGNSATGGGGGTGGGITGSLGHPTTLINTTVSGNSADIGGGLNTIGPLTVINSTITGNTATSQGGGGRTGSTAMIINSIVAGNTAPTDTERSGGDFTGHSSLIGIPNGMTINDILDPNLADNGGPTPTHALAAGSPAINAGDNTLATDTGLAGGTALDFDQRGTGFDRIIDGTVDIGALESEALASPPQAPENVIAADTETLRPTISWDAEPNATSYGIWFIKLAEGATPGSVVAGLSGLTSLSFTPDADLVEGNYSVWVRSINAAGASTWSIPATFRIGSMVTIPAAPASVTVVDATVARPTIEWTPSADATSYGIWFINLAGGVVAGESGLTGPSFTPSTDLATGNYRVYVRAFNSAGVSAWSTPLTFFSGTLSAPQPPTDVLVVDPSVARPEIQWTGSAGATSYGIWFIDQAGGVVAGESGLSGLSFTPDSDLTPGHNYSVYIRAFNLAGVSNWSTPLMFRAGESETIPEAPQNVTAINTNTPRPTIQWDAVQDAMSYGIWFVNLAGGVVAGESGLTDLSFTPNTDLADGNYRVWIRAFNSAGVSDWSTPLDLQILTVAEVDMSPVGKSLSSALELVSPIPATPQQSPHTPASEVDTSMAWLRTVRSAAAQRDLGEEDGSMPRQQRVAIHDAPRQVRHTVEWHRQTDRIFSEAVVGQPLWLEPIS